jgi:hypothetical protein
MAALDLTPHQVKGADPLLFRELQDRSQSTGCDWGKWQFVDIAIITLLGELPDRLRSKVRAVASVLST